MVSMVVKRVCTHVVCNYEYYMSVRVGGKREEWECEYPYRYPYHGKHGRKVTDGAMTCTSDSERGEGEGPGGEERHDGKGEQGRAERESREGEGDGEREERENDRGREESSQ